MGRTKPRVRNVSDTRANKEQLLLLEMHAVLRPTMALLDSITFPTPKMVLALVTAHAAATMMLTLKMR